jgi:hypothetical protein
MPWEICVVSSGNGPSSASSPLAPKPLSLAANRSPTTLTPPRAQTHREPSPPSSIVLENQRPAYAASAWSRALITWSA